MLKSKTLIGISVALPLVLGGLIGCKKLSEFTEEQLAEAVANQMVSSYHAMSVNVSATGSNGNTLTFGIACQESGELTWAQFEEEGEICYRATNNACTYSFANRSFTVNGEYEACGFPPQVDNTGDVATVEDLDGRTLYITGNVTVSSANYSSSTCDYDLTISGIQVSGGDGNLNVSSSITGNLCGRRDIDMSSSISINNDFSVE